MAQRLASLEGKTVYLVDNGFGGGSQFMLELQKWFAEHMPSVKTVYKPISSVYTKDDPATWKEVQADGHAAIVALGH